MIGYVSYRLGCENFLNTQTYSNPFRAYRKNMGRLIGTSAAVARFDGLQEVEARRFVLRILQKLEDLTQHIRKSVFHCFSLSCRRKCGWRKLKTQHAGKPGR